MTELYHASVLHETTEDQWAVEGDLYINADEAQIVLKVLEILLLKRESKKRGSGKPR